MPSLPHLPGLPLSLRFWLFLYGYPNIAGSVLGLVGLALFFLGIIGPGWPYIVAGLYGLGWLLAWQFAPREMHLEIAREVRAEALLGELEQLVKRVHKHLPREAQVLLQRLRQTLAELLPRLADNTVFSQEGHNVEKTVRDYLPATLENYLRLPPAFARMHTLKDGKTAQSMLLDQLGLLDEQMRQMLANALRDDARALAENGAFLEQKFKPVDFFRLG
ncbi:MAG: hypothetical protein B7Y41_06815 [Hydrogenophilales bacterium 28-61-23]|nr:MAG: hypothetical protein B7Y41_06815 [Hydrogenophilales bacterium 28-61-23]